MKTLKTNSRLLLVGAVLMVLVGMSSCADSYYADGGYYNRSYPGYYAYGYGSPYYGYYSPYYYGSGYYGGYSNYYNNYYYYRNGHRYFDRRAYRNDTRRGSRYNYGTSSQQRANQLRGSYGGRGNVSNTPPPSRSLSAPAQGRSYSGGSSSGSGRSYSNGTSGGGRSDSRGGGRSGGGRGRF